MKRILFLLAAIIATCLFTFGNDMSKKVPYKDASLSIDQRVEDLLSRMTLEEKLYQISSIRLGEGAEIHELIRLHSQ